MFAAGRMRHRVILQAKSVTRDAVGGEVVTWVDQATVWADVQALSGRALIAAQQASSEVTAAIHVRHRADIQPDWRIKHGTDLYAIHALIPDGIGVHLNIQCSKGLEHV